MKPRVVNSGRPLGLLSQFPVALLAGLEPGLMLDVGAAVGGKTLAMLKANPGSRVIAYEPFPGNLPYLRRATADDPRVTIRPVAVGDRAGTGRLYVASLMAERFAMAGASGVGKLSHTPLRAPGKLHEVPVVRLDDEVREHVRFLKIDVQGGEYRVLRGAGRLIAGEGIDLIYLEFNGDLRVLNFLGARGYIVFDCIYLAWPLRRVLRNLLHRGKQPELPEWEVVRNVAMSSGVKGRHVWPKVPHRAFAPYCAWFYATRLSLTGLQTDLLCVHESFLDRFQRICLECGVTALSEKMTRS